MSGFDIGPKHVGDGAPCLIVGEVAQAHEGSLALAHAYIDVIADAGADAVKFQCHIAEAESTPDEPWRVNPPWDHDENRFQYWKRMEFTPHAWGQLKAHADKRGLIFLCSPFSVEAVRLLDPLVPAWKVASGEIGNRRLLDAIADTGKPILLSSGMATWAEWEAAGWMTYPAEKVFMQATSQYPCPPGRIGLNVLEATRRPRGLSDHSGTIYAGLAAVALGCDVLEVHVKLSKHEQGFDSASSITPEQLAQLVEGARFIEKAKQPVDKDALARELEPMRRLFMEKHQRRANYVESPGAFR
jgi:N,N'-diacetyllegionaminate synthase